jgi:hypothetical protein
VELTNPLIQENGVFAWTGAHSNYGKKIGWMDRWFMVFDKHPYNNMEVPFYFLHKIMGFHANYFDIDEF